MKRNVIVLFVLMAYATVATAQDPGIVLSNKPGWHKIGETTASFEMENESIVVMGADKFKSIKLKATDAPLNIETLQVYYESGEMEEIDVKNNLKAGAETKAMELKSPTQELKKVVFVYKTKPGSGAEKAHVELYGLK